MKIILKKPLKGLRADENKAKCIKTAEDKIKVKNLELKSAVLLILEML